MKLISITIIIWYITPVAGLLNTAAKIAKADEKNLLMSAREPLEALLEVSVEPECLVMIFSELPASSHRIVKNLEKWKVGSGFSYFVLPLQADFNTTNGNASNPLTIARKLRRVTWCVIAVLLSDNPSFLSSFAEGAQHYRFLVWTTKLIVVTRLLHEQVSGIINQHWTFTMMNTLFLNMEIDNEAMRCKVYSYLPYTENGPAQVTIASWSKTHGLHISTNHRLFPQKYINFHGAVVNVTSLPYPPYWIEEEEEEEHTREDGTKHKTISGTDGMLLHTVAQSLNFTIYNIPTNDWDEVVDLVVERVSFISPVLWTILPERLARFDMTYVYEWSFMAFCKARPPMTANWESLKDPLTDGVWLGIIVCAFVAPGILFKIIAESGKLSNEKEISFGIAVLEILGTLLGQNFMARLPESGSGRIMMLFWLIFTFIIGSAYQGNLTAHLTLPKFPSRPENVEELVDAVDVVTGASYISYFKDFFSKSDYPPYQRFGKMMTIGMSAPEGMQRALENPRSALLDIPRYMKHVIATQFTRPDGSTDLYIGKSSLLPGQAGWPVPHDAPFKSNLDHSMQLVIEAGLYEKWSTDLMSKARRESMRKQQDYAKSPHDTGDGSGSDPQMAEESSDNGGGIQALTVDHLTAPLLLFIAGLILGIFSFVAEVFMVSINSCSTRFSA